MPLRSTEAIIIGGHNLAEADRILVFYTKAAGKVRAVAEGARRIRSRFGGSLQLFAQGRLVYFERPNKTLHKVNEFAVSRSHQTLLEDLDRIALGSTMVEAVALGVEESEVSVELYQLLGEALDLLEIAARPALVLQAFMLHLLRLLGYHPELSECVRCRTPASSPVGMAVSPAQGGIVCAACRAGVPDAVPLSPEVLGFLRGASGSPLRIVDRISLTPAGTEETHELLQSYIQYVLGRRLRSAEVFRRL